MQIALYLIVAGAGVGLVLCVGVAAKSFWNERADYVRTPPAAISRHPERTGIEGLAEISFSSADGRRVAGWYAPSRNRAAIILVHGTGAERSSLLFETGFLSQAGFGVLAVDLPGQGASEGRTRWGVPERHAISAAIDWPKRLSGIPMTTASPTAPCVLSVISTSDRVSATPTSSPSSRPNARSGTLPTGCRCWSPGRASSSTARGRRAGGPERIRAPRRRAARPRVWDRR